MAIQTSDFFIQLDPIAENVLGPQTMLGGEHANYWPLPNRWLKRSDFQFSTREYIDSGISTSDQSPVIIYLHGSGTAGHLPNDRPLIQPLLNKGFRFISLLDLGVGDSSPSPFRFGYGNNNAPHFMSSFAKYAIQAEVAATWMANERPDANYVFVGQSRGASGVLAWLARMLGRNSFPEQMKGVLACGATIAGIGDGTWNDLNRNINTMSLIVDRVASSIPGNPRCVMAYGNADELAPPDYVQRIKMAAATPNPSNNLYFVTPGDYSHDWLANPESATHAVRWATQLMNDEELTVEIDGNLVPAIPGVS